MEEAMGTERFSMNWPGRVSRRVPAIVLTCVSLAVTSCAAPQAPRDASSAAAPVSQAPKILVVGVPQEPAQLEGFLGASGVGGGGIVRNIVHALLSVATENSTYEAQLASEMLS